MSAGNYCAATCGACQAGGASVAAGERALHTVVLPAVPRQAAR